MYGFLVIAQYGMDDIPLGLHATRAGAMDHIRTLQNETSDSLHDIALQSMKVLGRDASMQIEGAELCLVKFNKLGIVCQSGAFGLSKFRLCSGTVQPVVTGFSDAPFMVHFGRAEYERPKPVLSDSLREQASPIVDRLNDGTISESEGRELLAKLTW